MATALCGAVSERSESAAFGMAALEVIDRGVFGLDREGRLCFANHAARELTRDGDILTVTGGRLRGVGTVNRAGFDRALASVAGARPSASLLLHSNGASLQTVIVMIRTGMPGGAGATPRYVLVIADQPQRRRLPELSQLRELFGLTAAEARLAHAIAAGFTLGVIAARHGLQESTVRSQLRAVLRKTGCCRQPALVHLLAGIPVVPG